MAIDAQVIVVLGAGGHGRAVAELARLAGHAVAGFLDASPPADTVVGLPVWQEELDAGQRKLPGGASAVALGIGSNESRLAAADRYAGLLAVPLVHPAAWVSPSALLGAGTVVFPGAVVHTGARVGAAAVVNTGAIVEHDCELGDGVHVAPGAVLCGDVTLGRGALVGAGATILPGCRIGMGATIGAGAVVTGPVADGARVAGVPARGLGVDR